ncbi:hypothetical protein DESME_02110 [Desulfitobacterium metallireducens DSM 15288]|uniref:Uncharacterized protein n=1 Tax=Desulfitobacterium metallireducens DSM 15288 TaxID=871968 RepID=W0EFW4_9FIRM|nr:hypothetical protein DESME_02110 [Desulfitobacterium metallireducens DSM 15288]
MQLIKCVGQKRDKEETKIESIIYWFPFWVVFIIYYKVFRIADDVREIKKILKEQNINERNE